MPTSSSKTTASRASVRAAAFPQERKCSTCGAKRSRPVSSIPTRTGLRSAAASSTLRTGHECPVLSVEDAAADLKPVRVGIDETGRDRFAPHVEHLRSCGNAAARTDALDAVVFDDDVGILQYLIAFHGHDRRSANHNRALRRLPRGFEIHGDFLDARSEEHTSELQSRLHLVCRLLLEKKKKNKKHTSHSWSRMRRVTSQC